ncbi:secretin receptor-like [Argopecten irradians]|uniref:secretin receptor-like n=1 Tax=Argopecten irradians TaxID=31199 RepID=UPI00371685B9
MYYCRSLLSRKLVYLHLILVMEDVMNTTLAAEYKTIEGRVFIGEDEQQREIDRYHIECLKQILYEKPKAGVYCNRTWDGIACWPETEPGSYARMPCPDYFHGFYVDNFATRYCLPDGHWFVHPIINQTWTNYTTCFDQEMLTPTASVPELIQIHLKNIRLMYNIGYTISLLSLSIAVFVMIYFRKLHCPRNTVHVNLFVSFILRATVSILKETLLVQGLGLQKDVEQVPNEDTVLFISEGTHWECKLLFSIFYYVLSASYMWIFVEGIHLHTLILVSVFSERSSIKYYVILGWGSPFLYVIPWVVVRITKENVLCWNTNPTHGFFWIIKGPLVLSIMVNFFLFLNILRTLFTNMKSPKSQSAKRHKYRRLAKATLVLIPLFGIHYIVFIGFPDQLEPETEVVKLYFEMFFNSFQGLVVAILFCFMNGEVQMELLKRICRKRAYIHYQRYYRASLNPTSTKCVCQCHKIDNNGTLVNSRQSVYDSDGIQRHCSDSPKYNHRRSNSCVCKWQVDMNSRLLRYNSNAFKKDRKLLVQYDLRRAESCI